MQLERSQGVEEHRRGARLGAACAAPWGASVQRRRKAEKAKLDSNDLGSLRPTCRVCIPVPLFHCFGSVMGSLAACVHGATAVYPAGARMGLACCAAWTATLLHSGLLRLSWRCDYDWLVRPTGSLSKGVSLKGL